MKSFITKNKFFKYALVVTFWLLIWQATYMIISQDILFVSPFNAISGIFAISVEPYFWKSIFFSLIRVVIGFLLATIAGTFLAVLMYFSNIAYCILKPIILIIKTTPVASTTALMLVFIKSIYLPTFISFFMVMPIVWTNVFEGIKKVNEDLLQRPDTDNLSRSAKLREIYIPSVKPYFLSAVQIGIGFAWKSAVTAEVIANTYMSIGSQLLNAKTHMETQGVFAWTAVIIILSFTLEKLVLKVIKKI